ARGISTTVLAALMGHESSTITERRYVHLFDRQRTDEAVVGWGNGLILGYLMYSSGLVPRKMTWLGLVGGPLIILSGTLVLFGGGNAGGRMQGLATIPEAVGELFLGVYCTTKGFKPSSPILRA